MTTAAIAFVVAAVTSFFKKVVFPKFGKFGVHAILLACALIAASYYQYFQHIENVRLLVTQAITLFCSAIALYEVLLSYFPIFRSSDGVDNQLAD